jgi:hypothetical protein
MAWVLFMANRGKQLSRSANCIELIDTNSVLSAAVCIYFVLIVGSDRTFFFGIQGSSQ